MWEHAHVWVKLFFTDNDEDFHNRIQNVLDEYEEEGWELVSVVYIYSRTEVSSVHLFFKRKKNQRR